MTARSAATGIISQSNPIMLAFMLVLVVVLVLVLGRKEMKKEPLTKTTIRIALAAWALAGATTASALDLNMLYRSEIVNAAARIKWNGPALSDETTLALVACGVSWQPGGLFRSHKHEWQYAPEPERVEAYRSARLDQRERDAVPFGLSVLLEPDGDSRGWHEAATHLFRLGEDLDRVLVGILNAPDRLRALPAMRYAAADLLVLRANPRLLTLLLTLAESSDRYLRSRAVAALGVIAYRSDGLANCLWALGAPLTGYYIEMGSTVSTTSRAALRVNGISAVQQRMLADVFRRAAEDKNYHVRAAAALALGLAGNEDDIPQLQKLAKDHAYIRRQDSGPKGRVQITFPVRDQAAQSLARFGRSVEIGSGVYEPKQIGKATRGGQDVTKDHSDIHPDLHSGVRFTELSW